MARIRLGLAAATLLLAGCAAGTGPDLQADALLALDLEFARYSVANNVSSAFDHYLADDAIQLPRQREPVVGRAAIVDGLRALDDGWVLDWTPDHAELATDASLGYTWGRWELYRTDNPETKLLGKYLNVWRRGPDARWRVITHIGNQQPPVPD
jgi:ketosteroid isomerase-like protein